MRIDHKSVWWYSVIKRLGTPGLKQYDDCRDWHVHTIAFEPTRCTTFHKSIRNDVMFRRITIFLRILNVCTCRRCLLFRSRSQTNVRFNTFIVDKSRNADGQTWSKNVSVSTTIRVSRITSLRDVSKWNRFVVTKLILTVWIECTYIFYFPQPYLWIVQLLCKKTSSNRSYFMRTLSFLYFSGKK